MDIETTERKVIGYVAPVRDGVIHVEVETHFEGTQQVLIEWQSAPRDDMNGRCDGQRLEYGFDLEELRSLRKALTAAIRHLEDSEDE